MENKKRKMDSDAAEAEEHRNTSLETFGETIIEQQTASTHGSTTTDPTVSNDAATATT